jgi:hypothetical protein
MLDWPGKISIDFDGWNFLKFNLPPSFAPWTEPKTALLEMGRRRCC